MVTSYYIMKMCKNYKSLQARCREETNPWTSSNICRICLRNGKIDIFEQNSSFRDALVTFGDIQINAYDELPKRLCDACFNFIKQGLLFRETAKLSARKLKHTKVEVKVKCERSPIDTAEAPYCEVELKDEETGSNQLNIQEEDIEINQLDIPEAEYLSVSSLSSHWEDEVPSQTVEKKIERISFARRKKDKVFCKICNKMMYRYSLKKHMEVHDIIPKYVCEHCGKQFKLLCSYANHKTYSHGASGLPYKCSHCPYRGKNISLLGSHMRMHTRTQKYVCPHCPSQFTLKSNLNRHIKSHSEPEFKCDSCDKGFYSLILLRRHIDVHHLGARDYVCSTCGKAFGYRKSLTKHERKVHKRAKKMPGRQPLYLSVNNESDMAE